jgi:hypothetical protein
MKPRHGAALASVALLSGCSAAAWKDRGHDLAQIFDASFSFGPGMAADVRVTELAQVGFGDFKGGTAGLLDGRLAAASEERNELGVSLIHVYEYRRESDQLLDVRHPRFADPGWDPLPLSWRMQSDRRNSDVGVGLHVAYVGFNAAFRIGELFDFVAGCFGFDPLHDDAHARTLEELREQACSLDPATRDRAFDALLRRGEPLHGYAIYTVPDARPVFQRRAMEAMKQ